MQPLKLMPDSDGVIRWGRPDVEEPENYPPCRCGREVRKLNAASVEAKCVGCGYPEEACRCAPAVETLALRGAYDG